jgi:glycosyltransferase involved in cell wall biosynthesis
MYRSPSITELPKPLTDKTGWPWIEGTALPSNIDELEWPRITVVTPSYQQGPYLEETIRSVLLQGYPNLEYLVLDGGSRDASVEIIKRYEPWIKFWVSEKDGGQAAAINRGFSMATGEIFAWLNSDDVWLPNSLFTVANHFRQNPDSRLLYGNANFIDGNTKYLEPCAFIQPWNRKLFVSKDFIVQPAAFWTRTLWTETGLLDTQYNWGFDWEWFIRASRYTTPRYMRHLFALARITMDTKTMSGGDRRRDEVAAISRRHGGFMQPTNLIWVAWRLGEAIRKTSRALPSFLRKRIVYRGYSLYNRLMVHYEDRFQL